MDGRVVQPDDNIAGTGQFHFNCRGIWVSIASEEAQKPDITGVPSQLRDRIGSLGQFEQLAKPIPLKGSLAEEFTKQK